MFLIANNISTRDPKVELIFRQARTAAWNVEGEPAKTLMRLAQQCVAAGAGALEINIQQHYDLPEAMEFAVSAVQQVTDLQLCLSTNNAQIDPGLIHITSDMGQRHLVEVMEFLRALPDATESLVKSTCWLANCSAGAPRQLRSAIEITLLPMLAGVGLSSVFLDVLRRENRRAVRLIKIFNNEVVYSDSEVEP